jgi:hypothetical protein
VHLPGPNVQAHVPQHPGRPEPLADPAQRQARREIPGCRRLDWS